MRLFGILAGLLTCCGLLQGVAPASAQTRSYSTVTAESGVSVRLGVYGSHTKDCKPAPLPEITVIQSPKHGLLNVKNGNLNTGKSGLCKDLNIGVYVLFYQSKGDFTGEDSVTYSVKSHGSGGEQIYQLTLTVKPRTPRPGAAKGKFIDL